MTDQNTNTDPTNAPAPVQYTTTNPEMFITPVAPSQVDERARAALVAHRAQLESQIIQAAGPANEAGGAPMPFSLALGRADPALRKQWTDASQALLRMQTGPAEKAPDVIGAGSRARPSGDASNIKISVDLGSKLLSETYETSWKLAMHREIQRQGKAGFHLTPSEASDAVQARIAVEGLESVMPTYVAVRRRMGLDQ
jgi:hypothetical protein